jgi:putative transposase
VLRGLSSRRYPVGLEPVGTRTEQAANAASKSALSRRFVTATETPWPRCWPLTCPGLDLVVMMVYGAHFGGHTCVVALGIDIDGVKHPLSLVESSTENASGHRLAGLAARAWPGCPPPDPGGDRRIEGPAPRCARRVRPPSDRPLPTAPIAKCSRSAAEEAGLGGGQADARAAYPAATAPAAQAQIETLTGELDRTIPGRPCPCARVWKRP